MIVHRHGNIFYRHLTKHKNNFFNDSLIYFCESTNINSLYMIRISVEIVF